MLNATTLTRNVFVGRQHELGELKAALEDALVGQGRLVMLAGEPGIGKTRTAQEMASYSLAQGVQVLWGRCHLSQGAPPYWPWVQAIRTHVQGCTPEELYSQMEAGAADIGEVVPEVREKLPGVGRPSVLEPQQARFRFFDSVAGFFARSSQANPMLVVLDNIHWADQPSLMLLEFLAQELGPCRMLVLCTYRDTELTRRHPLTQTLGELGREPSFRRVALRGLREEEVGQFIQAAVGFTPLPGLVRAVHTQTEGNPLFLTEVVRLLAQEGKLTEGMAHSPQTWSVMIPVGVREVIGRRLDRLSEKCNQALSLASVMGREFELGLLEYLMAEPPSGWGAALAGDEVLEALEEALAARVIEEVPQTVGRYQFSHVLIQDTLSQELSAARRARLHRRIAETLEGLYGNDSENHAAELVYHFDQAGAATDTEKLVRYSLLAGEKSLQTYAHEEAVAHFERGLEVKGTLSALGSADLAADAETAALLFGLARAQLPTSDRFRMQTAQAPATNLRRAFGYYAQTGDLERVVAVAEHPNKLTEREVEVLRLIATGKSNSEIAEGLVLSIRTVERHITNIYTKIHARGRAEAACYALSHGLVLDS